MVSMGKSFPHKGISRIEFRNPTALFDYDVVLWDTSNLFYEYNTDIRNDKYQGYRLLNEEDSVKIVEDKERRRREILDLIEMGRTIVLFVSPPDKVFIRTGSSYSGTGRNRQQTINVTELSLNSFIPIKDFNTETASGQLIEFRGGDSLETFWRANKNSFYYKAYLTQNLGRPFLYIQGTKRIVGSWIRANAGHIILLPHLYDREEFEIKAGEETAIAKKFISSLVELIKQLQTGSEASNIPHWTLTYKLPGEEELRKEFNSLQEEQKKVLALIDEKAKEISNLERYKILISGKGESLKDQVIEVLNEIGIDAKPGPPGRDDIILLYEDQPAVAEVKGTNKSAAESHAAQLEKWVSEYFTEHGIKPKGILIVNPYHNIPLSERTEDPFPNQMLKYSINREHCLLTTVQLLCILLYTRSFPEKKAEILRSIFSTIGIFKDFEDFSLYLKVLTGKKPDSN